MNAVKFWRHDSHERRNVEVTMKQCAYLEKLNVKVKTSKISKSFDETLN